MVRTTFTSITPLPPSVTRQVVVDFLHDHLEMIDLNPLIKDRHPIAAPDHAQPEERRCVWYSLTDKISYLPGGAISGEVSYTCAFHDLPNGLQTHCYAPMGLDIRDRWSVGGSLPGEPPEPVELGLNAPQSGLYLREDVDMRCNVLMTSFVKKTLKKSHGALVDRLATKAHIVSTNNSIATGFDAGSRASLHSNSTMSSWGMMAGCDSTRSNTSSGTPPAGPLLPPPPARKPVAPYSTDHYSQKPYGGQPAPLFSGDAGSNGHVPRPHYPNNHAQPSKELPSLPTELPMELQGSNPHIQGALNYSGTVYRGNSRPHDYHQFTGLNPYEELKTPEEGPQVAELEQRNTFGMDPRRIQHSELE